MDHINSQYRIAGESAVQEVNRAAMDYRAFTSPHEGYAILLEKMDDLKEQVWKKPGTRDFNAMRKEAVQVAAMALRFIADVCSSDKGRM